MPPLAPNVQSLPEVLSTAWQCWPSSSYGFVITVFTAVTTCVNMAHTHFTADFPVACDSYIRNDGVFTYHGDWPLSS